MQAGWGEGREKLQFSSSPDVSLPVLINCPAVAAASLLNVQLARPELSGVGNVCWQFTISPIMTHQTLLCFSTTVPGENHPLALSTHRPPWRLTMTKKKILELFYLSSSFWSFLASMGRSCYWSTNCNHKDVAHMLLMNLVLRIVKLCLAWGMRALKKL